MEYKNIWNKVLKDGEEVQYEFSIGKTYRIFTFIVFTLIGVVFAVIGLLSTILTIIWVLIGAVYYLFYLRVSNAYALTDKRILIHKGWLSTQATSIEYSKITDMNVHEPFLERVVVKTGNLIINTAGTGTSEVVLKHIDTPYEVRKKIDALG